MVVLRVAKDVLLVYPYTSIIGAGYIEMLISKAKKKKVLR